jgi:TrmH family RNA methyltransferase
MSRDAGPRSEPISSRHNPRFRDAVALRDARPRRERGLTLIDGAREIERAVAAGARVDEVWVARERVRSQEGRQALAAVEAAGAPIVDATPELLARLAYGERDEGIVAIVATPRLDLDDLNLPAAPLVAIVESVEKPGNLGAIVRSADGAGVDAVIAVDPASDPWSPNAIRASIGTVFSVPIAIARAEDAQAYLERHGVRVVAADPDGVAPYHAVDLTGPVAIVLGAEAEGLSDAWRSDRIARVRVPMHGAADSLNVSATAAVLMFEARRQRDRASP